ncbi:hypothetical protein AB0J38_34865 [Streptomyces sp. NPDC050095]|uniref:hypothetical protein n=1 Tax=unclassified Streptomyces TaxID=2593676 RepID=UPI00342C5D71
MGPPPPPAPPAHAPGPAQPSAVGQFFSRALRGDWAGAAQAALWPVGLLLIAAFAFAIPSYGQDPGDVVVGFGDRMRIALASLLQGVGGSLEISGKSSGGSMYGSDFDSASSTATATATASISVVPLLVTVLWIVALVIGVRMLRTRLYARIVPGVPGASDGATAGLEAAVRVALLVAGGTLVLALIGQPDIEDVSLSTAPFLTALWTLLLALAVAGGVLHADDLRYRVAAARPGVRMTVRAFGTAVRVMGWVLLVAAVLGYIGLALFGEDGGNSPSDLSDAADSDFDGSAAAGLGAFLMLLPNLALAVLGLCWGAPLEAEGRGSSSSFGSGSSYEKASLGLSRLGDELGSGALVYALVLGLVCALLIGVLTARRSLDRREQLLACGLFFGLFLLLAGVGGLAVEGSAGSDLFGSGGGRFEMGVSVPDALLFGLLWVGGAAFVGPHLLRMVGGGSGAGLAPVPGMPVPGMPAQGMPAPFTAPPAQLPEQAAGSYAPSEAYDPYDPGTVHLAPPPADGAHPKRRVGIWIGTIAGAFVIGGGAAAGVLLLQDDGGDGKDDAKDKKPAAAQTQQSPSPSLSPSLSPSSSPTSEPSVSASPDAAGAPTGMPDVPTGYHQVFDEKGFSFVVPDVWSRVGIENDSQITYAGSTGFEKYVIGVIPNADYTSQGNLLTMEKHLKEDKKKTGYQRIRLETNTFQGEDGAVWEYTYKDEAGQTVHGIDQSYIAADGTEYTIFLTGKEDVWTDLRGTYQIGLDSWRLTDMD